jgi:hypothetical protein
MTTYTINFGSASAPNYDSIGIRLEYRTLYFYPVIAADPSDYDPSTLIYEQKNGSTLTIGGAMYSDISLNPFCIYKRYDEPLTGAYPDAVSLDDSLGVILLSNKYRTKHVLLARFTPAAALFP